MFQIIKQTASLARTPLSRSLPAFSTSFPRRLADIHDPTGKVEAPLIENEAVIAREATQERNQLDCSIRVPEKVDLSPVSGIPMEQIRTRTVRIYRPAKNAMQSGTNNTLHWEMEFDNKQRWENPLMGWTSSGDPLSNMKLQFSNPEEAIVHCEKNSWSWYIDDTKIEKDYRPKNYGINFSWNRRTRVSTK